MRPLQEETGLTRAVFALRSPDGPICAAKGAFGAAAESAFSHFEIDLQRPQLYLQLLKKS